MKVINGFCVRYVRVEMGEFSKSHNFNQHLRDPLNDIAYDIALQLLRLMNFRENDIA